MWTILKFKKNNLNFLKHSLTEKFGKNIKVYSPKVIVEKYKNNKIQKKEINLLGDYIFCYSEDFSEKSLIKKLNFVKNVKYFLDGFETSQKEITAFIERCKSLENKDGFISHSLFQDKLNKYYRFVSGPFTNTVFKIIQLQKQE